MKKIIPLFKPSRWTMAFVIVCIAAVVFLRLFGTFMLEDLVNYIARGDHDSVVRLGTILVIMYCVMFVLDYFATVLIVRVVQKIVFRLRQRISKKINKLPFSYYDKNQTGDVLSRITNDADMIAQSLNYVTPTIVFVSLMLTGSTVFMFMSNWLLAVVSIVAALLGIAAMFVVVLFSQKHFDAQQKQIGDVNAYIEEYYTGHTVVKTSNATPEIVKGFDERNRKLFNSEWKAQYYGGLIMPVMMFLSNLSFIAVCVVGGVLAFNGSIGFGTVVAFMIFSRLFSYALSDLAESMVHAQRLSAAHKRVHEFLNEEELEDESHITCRGERCSPVNGNVTFDNVKFGYEEGKEIIKGFTADIKSGSKVAIVGPTGAGKTTLVNLLMKFYKVGSGDIKIDGTNINDMRRENVSDLFGMVLQDTWLFEGTVRENLLYNMEIPAEREQEVLDNACRAAEIHHFIKTLPNGYETVLDETQSISDGQKQLLTIARAMIKNAPLLILDEATSSVDTRTEVMLQRAMDKLMKGHTSFIIAHRLSTIKNADVIFVMNHGDIVEKGTHDELLKNKGFYADLYNSQFVQIPA